MQMPTRADFECIRRDIAKHCRLRATKLFAARVDSEYSRNRTACHNHGYDYCY